MLDLDADDAVQLDNNDDVDDDDDDDDLGRRASQSSDQLDIKPHPDDDGDANPAQLHVDIVSHERSNGHADAGKTDDDDDEHISLVNGSHVAGGNDTTSDGLSTTSEQRLLGGTAPDQCVVIVAPSATDR